MLRSTIKYLSLIFLLSFFIVNCNDGDNKGNQQSAEKNKSSETKKVEPNKDASKKITMGIFPRRPAKATNKLFTPLAKYLESKLGVKVELLISKDFATYNERLNSGAFDLIHLNHLQYINIREKLGYDAIVMNEEFGTSKLKSAIFVGVDSSIKELKELKGKSIIFGGGKSAFISYIGAVKLLKEAGLTKDDYQISFAKNPPSALIALSRKQSDAAAAGNVVIKIPMLKKKGDDKKVKMLASSEDYPHLPWAVKNSMDKDLKTKIKESLLNLKNEPNGASILKSARVTGFNEADDKQYDIAKTVFDFIQ